MKRKNKITIPRKIFFYRKREKIKKQKIKEKKARRLGFSQLDKSLVHFFSTRRKKYLTLIMKIVTIIGDGYVWLLLCFIFFFVNFFTGLSLSIGLVLQAFLQQLFKRIFIRKRPYETHVEITKVINPPDKFSFPSGHTTAAFTMVFILYYLYPVLFVPTLILAIMIGISRIYLGLHYPTDVIAGVVLGFISSKLAILTATLIENLKSLL
ncbi:MAG: phosphatase PAP2 family protein [Brevinematia bacterium]